MFTNFTSYMYYIYSLSIKGAIFYIGCTSNPVNRYKNHYHDTCSSCYDLCRYWLYKKKIVMKMNVIKSCANKTDAFKEELKYIQHYSKFYPLLNLQQHPWIYTHIIPRLKNVKTHNKIKDEIQSIKDQINKL